MPCDAKEFEVSYEKPAAEDEADAREQIQRLTDEVLALERAWEEGRLKRTLAEAAPKSRASADLHDLFRRRLLEQAQPRGAWRAAVDGFVRRARAFVAPPHQRFEAEALFVPMLSPEGRLSERLTGAWVRAPWPEVYLRPDQLRSAPGWGIGFGFAQPSATRWAATELLRTATFGLIRDLQSFSRVEREAVGDGCCLISDGIGRSFEQLALDVLNEQGPIARHGTVLEDLLEKTDLRLELPGLKAPGARVQVALTAERLRHERKLDRIQRLEELVILSPRSLASALESSQATALLPVCERAALWRVSRAYGREAVDQTAGFLRATFVRAMNHASEHPLGPMALIPKSLRILMQRYTAREAQRACQARLVRKRGEAFDARMGLCA